MKIKDTQKVSWAWTLSQLAAKQRTVAEVISKAGLKGATSYEVAEALQWPVNSVSGRLSELEGLGAIYDCRQRRSSPYSGKPCVVWLSSEDRPARSVAEDNQLRFL